jgi:hypothetical protein
MRSPHKRTAEGGTPGGSEIKRSADEVEHPSDNESPGPKQDRKPFIDKHGHLHSEAILRNWSPAAIRALGIRRLRPRARR